MLKRVAVFGSQIGEQVIGDIIENNLPVEVVKLTTENEWEYPCGTESEIREWTEEKLEPYVGQFDVIVFCEPEMTLSSIYLLTHRYPDQKIIGYGQSLARVLGKERRVRVLLPRVVRRMSRYQEMKCSCFDTEISEGEYESRLLSEGPSPLATKQALADFPGGLVVIYTPRLICIKKQIEQCVKWRASVVDMCDSLFRDTCKALEFRGIDGRLMRDLKG
ncbi:hypothetical protein IJ103_02975 [Candidatus Saccharibacteria bacterium]|nr:hypothetical protein [Candidatus Saccharibacteria bacterium]